MKVMLLALRVEVAGRFADDLYHCMALMKAGCYWGVQVWKWNPLTHSIYASGTTDRYVSQDAQVQPYPCGAKHLLKFRERDRGEEKKQCAFRVVVLPLSKLEVLATACL
jgi:hypothetical protein